MDQTTPFSLALALDVLHHQRRVQPELWGEGSGLVHETRPSHATLKKKRPWYKLGYMHACITATGTQIHLGRVALLDYIIL